MRLLHVRELHFRQFKPPNVPPYAIASHRWVEDSEASMNDIRQSHNRDSIGYKKAENFAAFIAKHFSDIDWMWMDTCCINHDSSQEVSEAINSMFKWYRNSEFCLAYLRDVGVDDQNGFAASEWFTRGWTLQELLAPQTVLFLSYDWKIIGHKGADIRKRRPDMSLGLKLESTIVTITGIPEAVLCEYTNSHSVSMETKLEWVEGRETGVEEDIAYCLLGIFDVSMPVIYGEGKEKAWRRLLTKINKSSLPSRKPLSIAAVDLEDSPSQPLTATQLRELKTWLDPPDPAIALRENARLRHLDTGLWFLRSASYEDWKAAPSSFIWLYGTPGSGKTVLASGIIEDLLQYCNDSRSRALAYFYFQFSNNVMQTTIGMLKSLVSQLLEKCVWLPEQLKAAYLMCQDGRRKPSFQQLLDSFNEILKCTPSIYLVLEALDECTTLADLLCTLEQVVLWRHSHVHILVTSRRQVEIDEVLRSMTMPSDRIHLQSQLVNRDITTYVHQRLLQDSAFRRWRNDVHIRREIEEKLTSNASGMFRWAACQLQEVAKCVTRSMVEATLLDLPKDLDETYSRILSQIDESYICYAITLIRWLAFSERPLSANELMEVTGFCNDNQSFNAKEILTDPTDIVRICSSLVTMGELQSMGLDSTSSVRHEDDMTIESSTLSWNDVHVRLAHFSVKEYLVSDRIWHTRARSFGFRYGESNDVLARHCLAYLLRYESINSEASSKRPIWPLGKYAAKFWTRHAKNLEKVQEEISQEFHELAARLLRKESPAFEAWTRLYDIDQRWTEAHEIPGRFYEQLEPLYAACSQGLVYAVERMLRAFTQSPNVSDTHYGNALRVASYQGHGKVVDLLLRHKSELKLKESEYSAALQAGSYMGHKSVVQMLLDHGTNVNGKPGLYGTALQAAAYMGHESIVMLLLSYGASVNAEKNIYGTALQASCSEGHENIARLLLDHGADVNASGSEYGTALQAASYMGRRTVVDLVLSYGANVHATAGMYGTAIEAATKNGHNSIAELLSTHFAEVAVPNKQETDLRSHNEFSKREGNAEKEAVIERPPTDSGPSPRSKKLTGLLNRLR